MTKTKAKSAPTGVFLPGVDLTEYLEHRGDLRTVFDRVHAYFFENPGATDPLHEVRHKPKVHRSHKRDAPISPPR
jgi:hypothetical protein